MRTLAALALLCACAPAPERVSASEADSAVALGAFNVRAGETTVSGLSSGGYMAVQFATAYSAEVRGVGVLAGGPYWCAQGDLQTARTACQIGAPDADVSAAAAERFAAAGAIDATSNLARQKVWVLSGFNDGVVKRPVVDALVAWYGRSLPAGNLFYQTDLPAGHGQLAPGAGEACDATAGPYLNDCAYDAAGVLLQHLLGRLQPRRTGALSGRLLQFDQSAFTRVAPSRLSLARQGYVYVPASCAAGEPCRLHIAFHGCRQSAGAVGTAYVLHAGYNEWADSNHLIILYPQTVASAAAPFNPDGCWDWWGYNESGYATKRGSQLAAVQAMVARLAAGAGGARPQGVASPQLAVLDTTSTRVDLAWDEVAGATGYDLYRAACAGCAFGKVNAAPIATPSSGDSGLVAGTAYAYRVRALPSGVESAVIGARTGATPPACDPVFRDNVTHTAEGRAVALFGLTYARGTGDLMGPWNVLAETALVRTAADAWRVGTCR